MNDGPSTTGRTPGKSMKFRNSQNGTHVVGAGMATSGSQAATQKTLATRRNLLLMAVCGPVPGLAWSIDKPKRIGLLAFGARRPQSLEVFAARAVRTVAKG